MEEEIKTQDGKTQRIYDKNNWFEVKNNPISKVGVFQYSGEQIGGTPGKIYNVYRPAEELSDPETIDSFRLLPIVDDHTMLGDSEVGLTPAEKKGVHGVIGDQVEFKNNLLTANLKIFSDKAKKLIESGKKELSCGYRCVYKFVEGVYNGQNYDAIQTRLRGNHLAIVDAGRMGSDVAVLDSFKFTIDAKELIMTDNKKTENEQITLDSVNAKVDNIFAQIKTISDAVAKIALDAKAKDEDMKKPEGDACDKDKKTEDMTEEEKAKMAKDAEAEKLEKKAEKIEAMDGALKKISSEFEEYKKAGIKSFISEVSARDELAKKLSQHVGTFDHAAKTLNEVAQYGIEKLGLKCEKGQEKTALDGFLHNRTVNTSGIGFDSGKKNNSISDYLAKSAE